MKIASGEVFFLTSFFTEAMEIAQRHKNEINYTYGIPGGV